jgi:ATP adenylyltransferase
MDRLWTPWRYRYITGTLPQGRQGVPPELEGWPADQDKHCVFCNMIASVDYAIATGTDPVAAEKSAHIIERGRFAYTCLNAFPYSSGHILIVPYQHGNSLAALEVQAAEELIRTAQRMESALRAIYRPDGINLGMNLGEAAGAGVAEHIHLHGLPRWFGDTSFITVTAETRVLPELLDVTWARLRGELGLPVDEPGER